MKTKRDKVDSSDGSDDENSDEWLESYDSYDTDEELEEDTSSKRLQQPQSSSSDNDTSPESDPSSEPEPAEEVPSEPDKLKANAGWADAMAKILKSKKPMGKKTIVLSRAKKIKDVKEKKKKLDFEIVGDGADEDVKPNVDEMEDKKLSLGKKLAMKEYQAKGRVKPSVLDKDRERTLMKIATKGVVQLFNAVRQQQKNVEKTLDKAGKSQVKRERMLQNIDKKQFLGMLTGSVKSVPVDNDIKVEEAPSRRKKGTWSVLRDDFMMGAELKDWDKEEEAEAQSM